MKKVILVAAILCGSTVLCGFTAAISADDSGDGAQMAPKYTIAEIMNKSHRGANSLLRTVVKGAATDAQKAELLDFYKILAENKPKYGDMDDWAERTALLIEAAQAAVDGSPEASNMLTKASSCTGCHNDHK